MRDGVIGFGGAADLVTPPNKTSEGEDGKYHQAVRSECLG